MCTKFDYLVLGCNGNMKLVLLMQFFLCLVSNHFVISCVNSFKEFHFEYSYWLVIYLIDKVEQNLEILNIFDMLKKLNRALVWIGI